MPHDPELVAEARARLVKARQDLAAAEHEFKAEPPFLADIEELGEQCLGIDRSLVAIIDLAVPLTKYSWKYRYPGELEEPANAEAVEALSKSREVFDAILLRIPSEVRP